MTAETDPGPAPPPPPGYPAPPPPQPSAYGAYAPPVAQPAPPPPPGAVPPGTQMMLVVNPDGTQSWVPTYTVPQVAPPPAPQVAPAPAPQRTGAPPAGAVRFGDRPMKVHCHSCNSDVTTAVHRNSCTLVNWLVTLFTCFCCIFLIPATSKYDHACSKCGTHLGDNGMV
mmetsp:Transcript_25546/g.62129  ORF Transcript_25546/g.62129 Transcript_25546/m.62129 type:complete len:169 (+) Transcript_25546:43-549(+)